MSLCSRGVDPTYVGSGKRDSQRTEAVIFHDYGNIILKYLIITRELGILLNISTACATPISPTCTPSNRVMSLAVLLRLVVTTFKDAA